jgi:hypothetical protein
MLAEEFKTTVANGKIQIPDALKTEFEGCRFRVIVLKDTNNLNLRNLFKTTQALPQAQAISESEIIAEIAAFRQGL